MKTIGQENNFKHCRRCQSDTPTYTQPKGKHIGVYCAQCNGWIAWTKQNLGEYEIWFGKYRGKKLNQIKELRSYYNFMVDKNMNKSMTKAFNKIKEYLESS